MLSDIKWMQTNLSRRRLLASAGSGIGSLALADLLHADDLLQNRRAHIPPKASAVIWLFNVRWRVTY